MISQRNLSRLFHEGEIVYWCHNCGGYRYAVHFGMVDIQYDGGGVNVNYLVPRERRRVNEIPIDEFESEQRYKKLPKGWSCDTRLFEVTYDDFTDDEKSFGMNNNEVLSFIDDPEKIKEAYNRGYLVKKEKIFKGEIQAEITKDGYRIVKGYPMWQPYDPYYVTIHPSQLFDTYEEAKKIVDDNIAEFNRQAELSDYDWAVEQIDKTLDVMRISHRYTEREIQRYREFILDLDRVEDIQTKYCEGGIQWKYIKNTRWKHIELGVDVEELKSRT